MASSYGWAKNDILEGVYLDELFIYARLITRRHINEQRMALAIATNPHTKYPKKLWGTLDQQERRNEGREYLDAEFDEAGMVAFKKTLQRHSRAMMIK